MMINYINYLNRREKKHIFFVMGVEKHSVRENHRAAPMCGHEPNSWQCTCSKEAYNVNLSLPPQDVRLAASTKMHRKMKQMKQETQQMKLTMGYTTLQSQMQKLDHEHSIAESQFWLVDDCFHFSNKVGALMCFEGFPFFGLSAWFDSVPRFTGQWGHSCGFSTFTSL